MVIAKTYLRNTAEVWESNLSYCDPELKLKAHRQAKRVLTFFALEMLGLDDDQFEVRTNMGGIAVSGEVMLHTKPFGTKDLGVYVQISDSALSYSIMWRTVKSLRDYTGGQNMWGNVKGNLSTIQEMARFAETLRGVVDIPVFA